MATGRVRMRVLRLVGTAYGDLGRVLRAMGPLVAVVLLVSLAGEVVDEVLHASTMQGPVLRELIDLVLTAVQSFLLTPFFIAVHRFVVLGEITRGYVLDRRDPRFLRFFAWSLAVQVLMTVVFLLLAGLHAAGLSTGFRISGGLPVVLVGIFIFLRLTILFPAIAVDAPGASVSNAFADTKGHAFDIGLIFATACLPILALSMLLVPLDPAGLIVKMGLVLLSALFLTLFIAIASRIFQALAVRVVGRPAIDGAVPI